MNETIERARQAALDILQPSKKDLEHGLELHKNSLVWDAYGFAPRAAIDGDALQQALESGASEEELRDMSEDMAMTRMVTDPVERQEFKEAWAAAGVTCIFQNAGVESQDPLQIVKRLSRFTYVADALDEFLIRAVFPEDVERAHAEGKHCFYMSSNGVPLRQQWNSLEEELTYIKTFFYLGHRMMHVTYNRRNMIGDGCAEPGNSGLSDFGRAVVAELNGVGVIADVAHSGWRTSKEVAEISSKPVVASHSGCAAVNEHIRCKPDEVIRAIVDSGGFIGICCIPEFLGRSNDIQALLDHIDYVAKRFGVDHVAIGTDTSYTSRQMAAEQRKLSPRRRVRHRWEYFWPEGALGGRINEKARLSLSWTNWPLFTVGLVQRGYSDGDIQKILGGNVLRVAKAVLA
ncbi:MAG: dipeptidase [Limnochordia bacterium]